MDSISYSSSLKKISILKVNPQHSAQLLSTVDMMAERVDTCNRPVAD